MAVKPPAKPEAPGSAGTSLDVLSALRQSERELTDFFDNAAMGLHWVGPDGTILRVNQAELDMLGYHREEYAGHHIAEFHVDQPVIDEILATLQRGEAIREHPARLRRKDGAILHVLITSSALFEDGRFVHTRCFTHDVTERMAAEAALRESDKTLRQAHENYKALVWSTADSVWEADGSGAIDVVSPAWQTIIGQALDRWLGFAWLQEVHLEDRQRVEEEWRARVLTRDVVDFEFRVRDRRGQWRWISTRAAPTVAEDGVTPRWIGTYTDVTTRKQAEKARDGFVGVLSHELRTPITTILGTAELLARQNRRDAATVNAMIRDVLDESRRLHRLVEDLLVLTRADRSELVVETEPVLIHHAIREAVAEELERYPNRRFRVETDALPPVLADGTYVNQVLRNLLSNAAKYGGDDGAEIAVVASTAHGEIIVRIFDEGPGLPAGDIDHLFDLFYRAPESKRRQPGLGIGLFVVRTLMEAMGGRVWARRRVTCGSEFGFSLPVAESEMEPDR